MKKIIIVESPSKSHTIESYMGDEYKVLSSKGHIRDLSTKGPQGLGIDIEHGFIPHYVTIKGKEDLIKTLKKECQGKEVYLATDPDREGEAISYHLAEVLGIDINESKRIVFNEITKKAVLEAFNHVRKIDMNLVKSQETRRMLDRILGFKLSKLLQSKIKSKSAGRVQSVSLKLICDLEKEIQAFVSTAYYEIEALFDDFKLDFIGLNNKKQTITSKEEAETIKNALNVNFNLYDIEKKETNRESKPAYTTSTMQQDASNKLNFNSIKTMKLAQGLYEGKQIGSDAIGLITYMRTDSTRLSNDFIEDAQKYIKDNLGNEYLGNVKIKKQQNAQDAHEAIRPTSIYRTPEVLKPYLTNDEYKLYKLIYNRALASIMASAKFENTKVLFENNHYFFKCNGQRMLFDGYLKVYGISDDEKNNLLPEFKDKNYYANEIVINEKHTKPKSRYTEASLIKDMEELGIGRPSTYAQTLQTLKLREYIDVVDKKIVPTEQGILTSSKLDEYFSPIINVKYTASMENVLDLISKGEADSTTSLANFYNELEPLIVNASQNMEKIAPKMTDELCPECGRPLVIRKGSYGEFTACSGYPECRYIKKSEEDQIPEIPCPKCGKGHIVCKHVLKGKNKGQKFYACSNYPECKNIYNDEPINKKCPICGDLMTIKDGVEVCMNHECGKETHEVLCPKCKKGHFVLRVAKRSKNAGNTFYACSNYPKCKNIITLEPIKNCPICGDVMVNKEGILKCLNENCNHEE